MCLNGVFATQRTQSHSINDLAALERQFDVIISLPSIILPGNLFKPQPRHERFPLTGIFGFAMEFRPSIKVSQLTYFVSYLCSRYSWVFFLRPFLGPSTLNPRRLTALTRLFLLHFY